MNRKPRKTLTELIGLKSLPVAVEFVVLHPPTDADIDCSYGAISGMPVVGSAEVVYLPCFGALPIQEVHAAAERMDALLRKANRETRRAAVQRN